MLRINEEKLPLQILDCCPPGRRRRNGRPQNSWMRKVATGISEKRINSMGWIISEE